MPFEKTITDQFLGEAREQVAEDAWSDAWREGRAMSRDRAIELAFAT